MPVTATISPVTFCVTASGLTGGILQIFSYGIVIWAMGQAPIMIVAALRETSVLFALLLSAYFLKEKLTPARILAACIIVAGVIVTKLGDSFSPDVIQRVQHQQIYFT